MNFFMWAFDICCPYFGCCCFSLLLWSGSQLFSCLLKIHFHRFTTWRKWKSFVGHSARVYSTNLRISYYPLFASLFTCRGQLQLFLLYACDVMPSPLRALSAQLKSGPAYSYLLARICVGCRANGMCVRALHLTCFQYSNFHSVSV